MENSLFHKPLHSLKRRNGFSLVQGQFWCVVLITHPPSRLILRPIFSSFPPQQHPPDVQWKISQDIMLNYDHRSWKLQQMPIQIRSQLRQRPSSSSHSVRASHDGRGASGSSSSTGKSGDCTIILERHICCWCKRLFGAIMLRLKGTNNVDSLMWLSVKDVGWILSAESPISIAWYQQIPDVMC